MLAAALALPFKMFKVIIKVIILATTQVPAYHSKDGHGHGHGHGHGTCTNLCPMVLLLTKSRSW